VLRDRLRRRGVTRDERLHEAHGVAEDVDEGDFEDIEDDDFESEYDEGLEERVLEAFRNDPILSERAIDIGSISEGVIELAGWVEQDDEAQHAVTIARGVPGVETVVNRIAIGDEERRIADAARRFDEGDPALTEARWEGQRVGTGRRRQGTSGDPDRHADPKTALGDRWLREDSAMRDAAEEAPGVGERRSTRKASRGDRTGGAPVAPTGVPKGDHVVDPVRDSGGAQTERADM
jgi:BON domain